jgi:pimeloyl-ACP methyl ester carboxylesterase
VLAHEDRLRSTAPGLAAALRGMGTGVMTPLWGRLGELEMPVTWVVGERDAKFRALAPDDAVVIPGAGHAAHLENPAAVADAIR